MMGWEWNLIKKLDQLPQPVNEWRMGEEEKNTGEMVNNDASNKGSKKLHTSYPCF